MRSVVSGFNATFTLFWKLCRYFCAWCMRSFSCKILLFTSFSFESRFPLLFVEKLNVASILNVSLILVGLKQFHKAIFLLLPSFLFPFLPSVFSTIWASQLNSLLPMILLDKLSFGLWITSRSLQTNFQSVHQLGYYCNDWFSWNHCYPERYKHHCFLHCCCYYRCYRFICCYQV